MKTDWHAVEDGGQLAADRRTIAGRWTIYHAEALR